MPSTDAPGPLHHGHEHIPVPMRYTLGLDLGKMSDFSALAIAEERPERTDLLLGRARLVPYWADDPPTTCPGCSAGRCARPMRRSRRRWRGAWQS